MHCRRHRRCKGYATAQFNIADGALTTAKTNAQDNDLIPDIIPETLNFPYFDSDGDLVPDKFDACPDKPGLRRHAVARFDKDAGGGIVDGIAYTDSDNVGPASPGPQDYCPSGCPETDGTNLTPIDSDGDGINDCEDRYVNPTVAPQTPYYSHLYMHCPSHHNHSQ